MVASRYELECNPTATGIVLTVTKLGDYAETGPRHGEQFCVFQAPEKNLSVLATSLLV
jgi:hypothetical protein